MITLRDVHKGESIKRKIKKETYTKIYEQFSRQIRFAVERHEKSIVLTVPSMVLGAPLYNTKSATLYLKRQFERAGFTVILISLEYGTFSVSWGGPPKEEEGVPEYEPRGDCFDDLSSLMNLKKAAKNLR